MTAPEPAKARIRRRMRAVRRAIPLEGRLEAATRAAEALLAAPEMQRVRTMLLHHPIGAELPLGPLPERLRAMGVQLALPRTGSPDASPVPLGWEPHQPLLPDACGVLAPPPRAPRLPPGQVDAVLVPALAIDEQGVRLGRGGGHYDRLLARLPGAWRVGWIFAAQRLTRLPREPHDQPLHAVATEEGLVRLRTWEGEP